MRTRSCGRRDGPAALGMLLMLQIAVGWSGSVQAEERPAATDPVHERRDEIRWSVWLGNEVSSYAEAHAGQPAAANLALAQSMLAYRHAHRVQALTRITGLVDTYDRTRARVRVREAYVALSAGDWDVAAGKRLLRWGTGLAFTVTGVLDPPRRPADVGDRLDLNEGRELAGVVWVRGGHAVTLAWASGGVLEHRHETALQETWALRHNVLVAGLDLSLVMAREAGGVETYGGSFSSVLGSRVELHGELAHRRGVALVDVPGFAGRAALADDSRWGFVLGGKTTPGGGVTLMAEWHSTDGLLPVGGGAFAVGQDGTVMLETERRHALFASVTKARLRERPGWRHWDVGAILVANLSDGSFLLGLDVERRLGRRWALHGRLLLPGGAGVGTEYGMIPYASQLSLGLRCQL